MTIRIEVCGCSPSEDVVGGMILILSNKWDVTVDFVVKELQSRGYPYLRLNTEDLPELEVSSRFPDFSFVVEQQGREVDLSKKVGAVWYRRPGKPFEFVNDENSPEESTVEYVREQWSAWLDALQTIPSVNWVNPPLVNRKMESKIHQLRLADNLGFTIPETVISTRKEDLSNFFDRHSSVIAKALSSPLISMESQDRFVFSVHLEERPDDAGLGVCPTIFQQPILPKTDYRVTVVGDKVMPVRIEAEDGGSVALDWRTEKDDVRFVETELPERVEDLCRDYVREAGLVFGAIDLVRDEDGEFVFLEINPNGEWGWLQKPWGVPIAENLTDLLIDYDTDDSRGLT